MSWWFNIKCESFFLFFFFSFGLVFYLYIFSFTARSEQQKHKINDMSAFGDGYHFIKGNFTLFSPPSFGYTHKYVFTYKHKYVPSTLITLHTFFLHKLLSDVSQKEKNKWLKSGWQFHISSLLLLLLYMPDNNVPIHCQKMPFVCYGLLIQSIDIKRRRPGGRWKRVSTKSHKWK